MTSSREYKPASKKVSLSTLLNFINSIASQEGQILFMTTNHIKRLDKALIRPGRMDRKVELRHANNKITANLFCLIFKPKEGNIALPKNAQLEAKRVK